MTDKWPVESLVYTHLATHELKLETGILVVADNSENDESGLDAQGQGDHGQFSVVPRVSGGQVEVGEVHHVVVLLALFVEEPGTIERVI